MDYLMKLFSKNKKPWDKPFSEKVAKRVSRLQTAEIESWVDQSLYEIGRCLSMYQRTRDDMYLDEALLGSEAAHAMLDSLRNRTPRRS
jgi:hypothetical protein